MVYYADTSVLAKRHLEETGRVWVRALTKPTANNTIFTAQISLVELYSALNRQLRKRSINSLRYARLSSSVSRIWGAQYLIVATTAPVLEVARQLVEQHPLKAYDAVQLASAMQARQTMPSGSPSIIFLSADNQLLSAATAQGFITDNPNRY